MASQLNPELQELLDRWVRAIEEKDLEAMASLFLRAEDLTVCWSNGERNRGWEEVRRHIETDFRQDVELRMRLHDVDVMEPGEATSVISYRYDITVTAREERVVCSRQATMVLSRGDDGWRVAALHVSTIPSPGLG